MKPPLHALLVVAIACASCASPAVTVQGYTVTLKTAVRATAPIGLSIPVVFVVAENESDGSSRPAGGKTFTVAVAAGGGTINGVAAATLTTDSTGSAAATWVLGTTTGAQTLHGSISSGQYLDVAVTATPLPTLLVTNSSCIAGGCRTLEVRAFVWGFRIPQAPLGSMTVGQVGPGQKCFVFPPSWTVRVIGLNSAGQPVDTTYTTWTPDNQDGIYLVAVDSAIFHDGPKNEAQADSLNHPLFPFDGFGPAVGETPTFVPGEALGWTVSFPSAPVFAANLSESSVCHP